MSARKSLNNEVQLRIGDNGELITISDTHEIIEPWPSLRATGLELNRFAGLYDSTAFQLWSRMPEEPILHAWFQQIPQPVREVIQRYRAGKYQVARLCSVGEFQLQLAKENIGVSTALAVELDRTHQPSETTEEIYRGVGWGRRDLLKLTGFEPRPAVWRTLARMTPTAAVPAGVGLMKELLDDWALRRLGYVCRISPDVLVLLGSPLPRRVKSVQLLQAAAETGEAPWTFRENSVTATVNRILAASSGLPKPDMTWTKLRTLVTLAQAEERVRQLVRMHEVIGLHFTMPIAERPDIRFVATGAELWREGKEMKNCIARYAHYCRAGRAAVYRVTCPQRCTLLLRLDEGQWNVQELKAYANAEPHHAAASAVKRWLVTEQRRVAQ